MNVWELLSLKGRVAVVTGGAGLYGVGIARGLAEAGAAVFVASRNLENCRATAKEMEREGLEVKPAQVDIADEDSVTSLAASIVSECGKVDILVNNAVSRPYAGLPTAVEAWRESMRINAVGLCVSTTVFLDQMVRQGGGNIINIASMYGLVAQDPHMYEGTPFQSDRFGDYFFHKAGMINYTRYLAARYAESGIRVNCISPGGLFANQPQEFLDRYYQRVPLGRMANEDDIKGAVVYLASDASAYVTGHNLVVDGGWTIW